MSGQIAWAGSSSCVAGTARRSSVAAALPERGRAAARAVALAAAVAALLAGCVVRSGPVETESAPPAPPPSGGSASPVLADVDTGRTMTAAPGSGVGVFTEYQAGGHWHVWWTCDTSVTGLSCSFQVEASVASGAITNVSPELLETGDTLDQPSGQSVRAVTTTTTGTDGMTFDTAPGAVITLDAVVNGQRDGAFLFFVQNGAVNGGYAGTLTDPLMLEPSSP